MASHPRLGLVAAGHPQVAAAAGAILEAGGNAFDATVAAGFAAGVAEPTLSNLGGGGFLLAHTAAGEEVLFDFFADTPGRGRGTMIEPHFQPVTVTFPDAEQIFHVGLGAAAVPGCLRGYLHVHARLGRLPLEEVLAPAVQLARCGAEVTPFQAETLSLLEPIVTMNRGMQALFTAAGRLLEVGEHYLNPELAAFLEALPSEGDAPLYLGELGERIVADMDGAGGLMTRRDLAEYRVIERTPLEITFRGARVITNPAPSFGGRLIGLALELLAQREPTAPGSAACAVVLAEVMAEVDARRSEVLDPGPKASRGTTHVSVWDSEGNLAAMTTSNGEGSGYVVPGAGIVLNNMLGEDDLHPDGFHNDPPGLRVASMMAPTLVLRNGRPTLALGSGGSKRIRSAIAQVLINELAHGMPLAEAVAAPRLHLEQGRLELEPGLSAEAVAALEHRWPLNLWSKRHMFFGGVHAVAPPGEAVGDGRRSGVGLAVG